MVSWKLLLWPLWGLLLELMLFAWPFVGDVDDEEEQEEDEEEFLLLRLVLWVVLLWFLWLVLLLLLLLLAERLLSPSSVKRSLRARGLFLLSLSRVDLLGSWR